VRVLHVIADLDLGGAETLLYRLVTRPSAKATHEVVCLGQPGWYSPLLERHGIVVHHLNMAGAMSTLGAGVRFRQLISGSKADVVQSWMYLSNLLSGIFARRAGIPVVWSIHNSSLENVGLRSRVSAFAGGLTARWLPSFVVNCSAYSAKLHARYGYGAAKGAIIANGYDPAAFFPSAKARNATRKALGIDKGAFVIGSISRWHSQKDIPTLVRALGELRQKHPDAIGLLIGRGLDPSNSDLMREIEKAGVSDKLLPLGIREDVADLARAMDVHVLASRTEAFPNVVAETMLSGVPNIVTDVGDSGQIVGDTGWIVPARDPLQLAEAIGEAHREWVESRDNWAKRSDDARSRIASHFTFERMAERYEELWTSLSWRRN
jgi:glycosyltransferase involved in cell wall biosynthesis